MDTIDLLEAIGSDASLRHMPGDELARKLEAQASEALKTAAASGDNAALVVELGAQKSEPPQVTQAPGHEEEEAPEEMPPLAPEEE
ncbi:hypothetical protein [Dyella sp. 2RAB6]|uniref:hypothetical protein n=1 Tax=Dyella sp. 2RAB6 TaxID=3232992 RepID=UPI003F91F991